MRASAIVPCLLLLAGAGLLVDAVLQGGASVALVVVVPVVFGGSVEFFLGVLLLFLGLVTLPWALGLSFDVETEESSTALRDRAPSAEVGGLILIGPVPIFFGRWRSVSRRTRLAVAALGGALVLLLVIVVLVGH
ncbi:MAG: TIGR00304 family membrane protein [Thermoplasmata archaeon]